MTYQSTVQSDSPLHYWRAADGGGQLLHDIGSLRTLLFSSFQALGYSGPNSDGGAAYLDGTDGLVSGVIVPFASPLSLECWIWLSGLFGVTQGICLWDNNTAPSIALTVLGGVVSAGISGSAAIASPALSTQAWHHIVLTYDEANLDLYVDGALSASTPFGTHVTQATNLIGWGENPVGGGNKANLLLSEMAAYGTALSAARVAAHFAAADSIASIPVVIGPGVVNTTNTSQTFTSAAADIAAVLASVRKVF